MAESTGERVAYIDAFFGNAEHRLSLVDKSAKPDPWGLVREMEKQFNLGPAQMFRAFYDSSFTASLARETIRLGLIGGGMKPVDAHVLVQQYFDRDPLTEHTQICLDLWSAVLFGRSLIEPTPEGTEPDPATPENPT